jgi:hypothetical protein
MATAKKNLGKMPCPCCGDPVAVHQAETGTLSFKCQDATCETSGFAAAHTGAAKKWLSLLPKTASEPAPAAAPTPPKKTPSKAGFDMGAL